MIGYRPGSRPHNSCIWRRFQRTCARCEFAAIYSAGFLMLVASIVIALPSAIELARFIGRTFGE